MAARIGSVCFDYVCVRKIYTEVLKYYIAEGRVTCMIGATESRHSNYNIDPERVGKGLQGLYQATDEIISLNIVDAEVFNKNGLV